MRYPLQTFSISPGANLIGGAGETACPTSKPRGSAKTIFFRNRSNLQWGLRSGVSFQTANVKRSVKLIGDADATTEFDPPSPTLPRRYPKIRKDLAGRLRNRELVQGARNSVRSPQVGRDFAEFRPFGARMPLIPPLRRIAGRAGRPILAEINQDISKALRIRPRPRSKSAQAKSI